jgi:hypothetical protein
VTASSSTAPLGFLLVFKQAPLGSQLGNAARLCYSMIRKKWVPVFRKRSCLSKKIENRVADVDKKDIR